MELDNKSSEVYMYVYTT